MKIQMKLINQRYSKSFNRFSFQQRTFCIRFYSTEFQPIATATMQYVWCENEFQTAYIVYASYRGL